MVWSIAGHQRDLTLGISDNGKLACYGTGNHEPVPPGLRDWQGNINGDLLKRIRAADCAWSLHSLGDSELHIDPGGEGLFARAHASSGAPQGMAKFYTGDRDTVSFSLVVPEQQLHEYKRLLELVLMNSALRFVFVMEFLGFRVPHAQTETPTWEEFIGGKPLFIREFSISVHASRDA
jgi:hypothetical protein